MSKIYNIKGVKLACASSNTRYGKRDDSLVITLDEKSTISGKFTSNSFKAAPIKIAKKKGGPNKRRWHCGGAPPTTCRW